MERTDTSSNDGDRLFMSPTGLLSRSAFIEYLNRYADDWMKVADGSFYGIIRRSPDAEAVRQSNRVRALAQSLS